MSLHKVTSDGQYPNVELQCTEMLEIAVRELYPQLRGLLELEVSTESEPRACYKVLLRARSALGMSTEPK